MIAHLRDAGHSVGIVTAALLAEAQATLLEGEMQNLVLLPGNEVTRLEERTNESLSTLAKSYGYQEINPVTMAGLLLGTQDEVLGRRKYGNIVGLVNPSVALYIKWAADGFKSLGASSGSKDTGISWGDGNMFVFETDT